MTDEWFLKSVVELGYNIAENSTDNNKIGHLLIIC